MQGEDKKMKVELNFVWNPRFYEVYMKEKMKNKKNENCLWIMNRIEDAVQLHMQNDGKNSSIIQTKI